MKYYPVMMRIDGALAVVVGGGTVALRKIEDLLAAGARLRVIAPQVLPQIRELQERLPECVSVVLRDYTAGDLDGAAIVFSATDDAGVNAAVHRDALSHTIPVNAVDDPEHSSFIVPSWFSRGDLIVAVSTSGASPSYAARLRREIESLMNPAIEELLEALKAARDSLLNNALFSGLTSPERGAVLKGIVANDGALAELVQHYRRGLVAEFLEGRLKSPRLRQPSPEGEGTE